MKNKQNTDIDTAQLQVFLNNALRAMGSLALALDQLNNDTAQLQVFLNNTLRAMGSLALALDQLNNLLPARVQLYARLHAQ
jgi:hypothetical protein